MQTLSERGEIQRSCSAERDLAETANRRLDMVLQEDTATEKANEILSTYAEASPCVTDQRDSNPTLQGFLVSSYGMLH